MHDCHVANDAKPALICGFTTSLILADRIAMEDLIAAGIVCSKALEETAVATIKL